MVELRFLYTALLNSHYQQQNPFNSFGVKLQTKVWQTHIYTESVKEG